MVQYATARLDASFAALSDATRRGVLTNEEDEGEAITTVTFESKRGNTLLVLHELHPSKEAVDGAIALGEGMRETFEQLDELLVTLGASR